MKQRTGFVFGVVVPVLLMAFVFLSAQQVVGASVGAAFSGAWNDFHALVKNPKKAKYRSYWKDLETRFYRVYERAPRSSTAVKSLYYCGRVNEELAARSYLQSDFVNAVNYYSKAVSMDPGHEWADDCLYRKAYIEYEHLSNPSQARDDLNTLLTKYTKGDMWWKAKRLLAEVIKADEANPGRDEVETAERKEAPIPPPPAGMNVLQGVRHRSSDEYTRVVIDLKDEAAFRYKILDPIPKLKKPHRLYIDLDGTALSQKVDREINISDGILRRVRIGQYKPETSRVVLDLLALQKYHIFALENPFRIVVDVSAPEKSDVDALEQLVMQQHQQRAQKAEQPEKYTLPPGSKDRVGELVEQLGLTVETIMLDPGHGGKDPGAVGRAGMKEKDVNLRFALLLGDMLRKQGFKVLYTRSKDVFIPLEERTAMANVNKADLFISIHCNAYKSSKVNGFETYYLNLAKSEDAVRVAARENAVSAKKISDLQFILTDLMLNSKMKESKDLADNVHGTIVKNIRSKYKIRDHGVRSAPFYVLMGAKMPSILVELGYITNPTEAERLKSQAYLERKAQGLVRGISSYKKNIERFAGL